MRFYQFIFFKIISSSGNENELVMGEGKSCELKTNNFILPLKFYLRCYQKKKSKSEVSLPTLIKEIRTLIELRLPTQVRVVCCQ